MGWIFVNQRLAPLVERDLEQILKRPVNHLGDSFINTLGRGDAALWLVTISGSTLISNFQVNINQLGQALGIDELRLLETIVTDPAQNVSILGLVTEAVVDITTICLYF